LTVLTGYRHTVLNIQDRDVLSTSTYQTTSCVPL